MKKPFINIPKTPFEQALDAIGLLALAVLIGYTAWVFPALPELVPGHYDASGEVTRFGSKWEIWILPVVGAALWLLLHVLEKFPHRFNYINLREDNREAQYRNAKQLVNVLKNECAVVFAWINWNTIHVALGKTEGLGPLFLPVFFLVFAGTISLFFFRMLRF